MGRLRYLSLFAICFLTAAALRAQQPCPGYSVVVNTPEDQLMLAINGAESPQEQIEALDKFSQEHADSKFMPCVLEYYTSTYLKLKDYDKAIESGEKDLAGNYQSVSLLLNLLRAYVASGKASDTAFSAIMKVPDQIKTESNAAIRPANASDADWEKAQQEAAKAANDDRAYAVYAFFQLLPRLTDASKRLGFLDQFGKAYPDAEGKYASQIDNAYFQAYQMSGNVDKMVEYGEKSIAADPNNPPVYNTLAYVYAVVKRSDLDKASDYANKALNLVENMKKPEGVSDEDFKKEQNNQLGMAHLTLGYIEFLKAAKNRRLAPAIKQLREAEGLLDANPELLGQALYYLGNAYEFEYPANHRAAVEVLTKASNTACSVQAQSKELLAKVRRALRE
jgi:hypothetical protein